MDDHSVAVHLWPLKHFVLVWYQYPFVIFSGCACTLTVLTGRRSSRMESAPDLLHLFVQALALFATSLDRWFHVPLPLSITLLFIPVVAILDMVVWYVQGRAFPIL